MIGAVTFSANLVLMRQSGYFDGAAESKPFLHFWSLALEEQYYLFMPLLLTFVGRRWWVPVMALLSAISLAASFWLARRAPDLAFYLLPTLAWELGIGSLIALVPLTWMPREFSPSLACPR